MKRAVVCALLAIASASGQAQSADRELNAATRAQIEQVRGVGVELADRLLAEREKRPFRDWSDLTARVRGLGAHGAQRLSDAGWRIDGAAYPRR